MHPILTKALDAVGIPNKARFTIEEVAVVLAIRRDQVVDLLKKGRLRGIKSSPSRWRWIYADDLGEYFSAINESRGTAVRSICTNEAIGEGPSDLLSTGRSVAPSQKDVGQTISVYEQKMAKAFVNWLGNLSTLDYQIKSIDEPALTAFYFATTKAEAPDHAPVFLRILRDAIKASDILLWEIGTDNFGRAVFGGADLPTLTDLFKGTEEILPNLSAAAN